MVTITLAVVDRTALPKKMKDIVAGAKKGVRLATEEGVQWIHTDVFGAQKYVGSGNYPDVTPTTKLIKAKAGRELVGVWTGNLKASFNSAVTGLVGKITGAGYPYFLSKWHIDALFKEHRSKRTRDIIEKEIKGKTK